MKKFSSKRALFLSILSMMVCVSMLIGSTFAWFTDSATASVNTITSGNLKIELEMMDANGNWVSADKATLNFIRKDENGNLVADANILWEPGCTFELPMLRVRNDGDLALKYQVVISGATGDLALLDVIKFTAEVGDSEGTAVNVKDGTAVAEGMLVPASKADETNKSVQTIKISAHMDETAGNDYRQLKIENITINVLATQATYEYDSNGNTYDKFAEFDNVETVSIPAGDTETVNNAVKEALANIAAATGDESNATQIVLPAGANVTIDSGATKVPQGKTKNIKITGDKSTTVALQGTNGTTSDVGKLSYQDGANITFEGVTYDASQASGICARGGVVTFIDCKITGEMKQTIASKFVFSGCEFTSPVSQTGYGCKDVVFDGCTFTTSGYGIKIYSEGSTPVNVTVRNSSFKNTTGLAKSAIFLDHIIDGISYNITVENCTFEGFTAEPTPNYNRWATRVIVADSFVKTADGQYIFAYQTGEEGGNYHKILSAENLVVTVK